MIEDAFKYPIEDEKWVKKGVIGSLLVIGSLFIIPAFLLLGYLVRVMREESLPEFNNIGKMAKEGFQATAILTIYLAIPLSITIIASSELIILSGILLLLVAFYSIYAVTYELANNGWKAALSPQVFKNAFTLDYFIGFILATVVSNIIGILWLFSLLLIVTVLLMPAVYFYQYLLTFRIMAEAIERE